MITQPNFGSVYHMDIVKEIIGKLGGVNGTSEKTGFPQQTVSAWICREPPEIPPWRRSFLMQCAKDANIELDADAKEYLASFARRPKVRADRQEAA